MRVQNWMIEVSIVVLVFGAAAGLTGCIKEDNREPVSQYQVEAEGCIVKYIDNPKGYNFFIAKCPAESETITHQRPKRGPEATVVTSVELRKQLAEVEAKERALAKLSDDEKKLLGVK
jgi:hypothetical protein